jgi:OOP family OmpA-OmpF porin
MPYRIAKLLVLLLFSLLAMQHQAVAASDPNDCQGCKDPALFNRMPGFHLYNTQETEFDRFEFPVSADKKERVEGHRFYYDYYANDGIKLPSALQIVANYTNAAKAIGGKTLYEYDDGGSQYVTLKVVKEDREVWVLVEGAGNGMYKVNIVEKQRMRQDVVANAESLAGMIKETGKAAVYGIYFDTGKSDIKPSSAATIAELIKLLTSDPALKLYVVGHTDNVGGFEYNVKLSQARAAAVVKALVGKNIAASRLTPFGAGPTSPAASNTTEEGRAKNRRVELVAQ